MVLASAFALGYNIPLMETWDYRDFWSEALRQLKREFSDFEQTWLNIEYRGSSEKAIKGAVPSAFYRDQLISKGYKTRIEDELEALAGERITLELEVKPRKSEGGDEKLAAPLSKDEGRAGKLSPQSAAQSPEANVAGFPAQRKKDAAPPTPASSNAAMPAARGQHPLLKPEYTFDNFVIGDNNDFAANASMAVASNPGKSYNPLLLYGGVGLGKTHLMEAIGNHAWEKTGCRIIYITAEDFLNDFVEMVGRQKEARQEFKNKYRKTDILLIDDIHFFQGKEACQEEVFHIFNSLYKEGKQIVFTCDRHVTELSKLHERLRSRCEMGLNIDLQPPGFETRCAILKKKAEAKGASVSDAVIKLIAENVSTNVRDLEGCLNKVIAYAEFKRIPVTKEIAASLLKDSFSLQPAAGSISIDSVLKAVASYFNVSYSDIKGKKRSQSVTLPRHVAMYLCRELTEFSTTEIGLEFGGRDHTTVMHACQKIEDKLKAEPSLDDTISKIKKLILTG